MNRQTIQKKARRYRGWITGGCVLLALVVGWQILELLVNVDRYRPVIVDAIVKATGLPATVGRLDIDLVPTPHLSVYAISIGEGDFRVTARDIAVYPEWSSLLRKPYVLERITVTGLIGRMPNDVKTLTDRVQAVVSHAQEGEKTDVSGGMPPVLVRRLVLRDAEVYRGAQESPALRFVVDITEPMSEEATAHISASMKDFGDNARLTADLMRVPKSDTADASAAVIKGTLALQQVECPADYLTNRAFGTQLNLNASVVFTDLQHLAATVQGDTTCSQVPALTGSFSANTWWREGASIVNDLVWEAPGLRVGVDITRDVNGAVACALHEATADRDALTRLAAALSTEHWGIQIEENASASFKDWLIGMESSTSDLRIAQGQGTIQGIRVTRADTPETPEVFSGVKLDVSAEENVILVNSLEADGMHLKGKLIPDFKTSALTLDVAGTLALTPRRLGFAGQAETLKELDGTLEVTRLWGTITSGPKGIIPALMAEAALHDAHATIVWPTTGESLTLNKVSGTFSYKQRVLTVKKLSGEGFALSGAVTLDDSARRVSFAAQGTAEITRERLSVLAPVEMITKAGGSLAIHRVEAAWENGQFVSEVFAMEGTMEKGAAEIEIPGYSDTLDPVVGTFRANTEKASWTAQAESRRMGPLHMEGEYTFSVPSFKKKAGTPALVAGVVSCDVARAAGTFIPEISASTVNALLGVYGASTFDVKAVYGDTISVEWARQGKPSLTGNVAFDRQEGKLKLGRVEVDSALPVSAFGSVAPVMATNQGEATFHFTRDLAEGPYSARLDFSGPELAIGTNFRKRAGDPLVLEVTGDANDWSLKNAALIYRDRTIPARFEKGRLVSDALDVDLAGFSGLLPEGGKAQGHLRGAFSTSPATVELRFDQAGLSFSPQVGLDAVTGEVKYADGRITCRDIKIVGANSNCSLTAGYNQDTLVGKVVGEKLDLNAILAMWDAGKVFRSPENTVTPDKDKPGASVFRSRLDVDLKSLFYRRARFDAVRANVETVGGTTHIRDLSATPYTGQVRGAIDVVSSVGATPGQTTLNLQFEGIDARVIDELLFKEPREFSGTLTGTALYTIPTGTGVNTMSAMTGRTVFTGQNGSFGKLGFATKMLSVLKATDVLRLRLPSLKDEGLTYETCQAALTLDKGMMTVDQGRLRSPQFEMQGQGTLDFLGEQGDLKIRVNYLESVTGILEGTPIIGKAMGAMGTAAGAEIYMKGSVYNPEFQINPAKRIAETTKAVGETAVKAGGGAVSVGGKAVDAIGNILGGFKMK